MKDSILIKDIISNQFQPEINFSKEKIEELVFKINNGLKYLLIVKKSEAGYEVVVGEKILKALQKIGVLYANVIVSDLKDIKLFKKIDLKELSTIEEAIFYLNVMKENNYTQEELADILGKSQSTIANKIRILNLPQEIQDALVQNKISERHARSLLALEHNQQFKAYNTIIEKKLNVRDTETLVNELINRKKQSKKYLTKGFTRNIQIALNSINQCLGMIKQLGIDVEQEIDEDEDEVVITLTLLK